MRYVEWVGWINFVAVQRYADHVADFHNLINNFLFFI